MSSTPTRTRPKNGREAYENYTRNVALWFPPKGWDSLTKRQQENWDKVFKVKCKATIFTVCKNVILGNRKNNKSDPPLRVSKGFYGKAKHLHSFEQRFDKPVTIRFKYEKDNPTPWGARVWVEIEEG